MRSVKMKIRRNISFSLSSMNSSSLWCVHMWMTPFMSRYRLSIGAVCWVARGSRNEQKVAYKDDCRTRKILRPS